MPERDEPMEMLTFRELPEPVKIWIWTEKRAWIWQNEYGEVGSESSREAAWAHALQALGEAVYSIEWCKPPKIFNSKIRSMSASNDAPVSAHQTDTQDRSTVRKSTTTEDPRNDPDCTLLNVPNTMLPMLRRAIEEEISRTEEALREEYDLDRLKPDEAAAVVLTRTKRLEALEGLRNQTYGYA